MISEITTGYTQNADEIVGKAIFHEDCTQMITVNSIEFYSLCEHHLLPFFGKVRVAYIPKGKIIGVSKIPRIVNMFARRLQLQERLTQQIVTELDRILEPEGVACSVEAHHLCMMMRGIEAQSSTMTTTAMSGVFLKNPATRAEFLNKQREV
jgi:GTP cyclohydrolase I